MSAKKKTPHAELARTLRCGDCGEEFPHVYMTDECISCGAVEWVKPETSKRDWRKV